MVAAAGEGERRVKTGVGPCARLAREEPLRDLVVPGGGGHGHVGQRARGFVKDALRRHAEGRLGVLQWEGRRDEACVKSVTAPHDEAAASLQHASTA